jgi:hypothetical protein
MNELLNLVPWVLLFGIVLIGLSRWGRFDEDQRRKMWTVGIIAIAASVVGLLYIFQAPPGREITIEEDRDNRPTPKPNPTTLLKDQLDAPWDHRVTIGLGRQSTDGEPVSDRLSRPH